MQPTNAGKADTHHSVSHDEHGRKRFHVGTLTYTTGGLVLLFVMLLLGDFSWSLRDRSVGPTSSWFVNNLALPPTSWVSDRVASFKAPWVAPEAGVATLYYGTNDGGTNRAAWQKSVKVGAVKAGPATNTLSSLPPDTAHFTRAVVASSSGDKWEASSAAFISPKKAKLSSFWFGIFFSTLPALIAFVVGPIISVKSDRHRGRRGRRIPFLLVITPIAALGMVGIALTPVLARLISGHFEASGGFLAETGLVSVALFSVFWLCFEVASIASQPVFTGLINDVVPRPLIGRFYGLFRAVSLIDGMIFNYWLMGLVPTHFTMILLVIGIFYGIAFQIVCMRIREGEYPAPVLPAVQAVAPKIGAWASVRLYFKECFSNPFYVALFLMMMTAGITFGPVNIFSIPYANNIGMDMKVYGRIIAASYLVSMCLAYFLGWLADKIHPLRMAILAMSMYAATSIWGSIFATDTRHFTIAFFLHTVLSGTYFTGAATLSQRLFPHSKFAQFTSAAGMLGALAGIVIGPTMGKIIDATGKVYRHTFTAAAVLACVALLFSVYVYWQFNKLGGTKHYVAPLEAEIEAEDGEGAKG